ncbi:MAG: alpha-amylase [Dysgonamonadaceae bacterium]|jgi:glycosidase|nr:alpha-amylase [Dysgonamonadaceae bacterium]
MKKEKIILYQVLPRLFGNRTPNPVPNGSIEENGCGKLSAFTREVLQELKETGYTHIWYTGVLEHTTQTGYSAWGIRKDHPAVVKGKAGSPYAIKDYYDVDPDLADDVSRRRNELEALIRRTHQAGLKVIIDFVPNHVAREYFSDAKPEGVEDPGASDDKRVAFAPNNNFYYLPGEAFAPEFDLNVNGNIYREYPAKATGNDCFSARPSRNDWYETVKLNYGKDYLAGGRLCAAPVVSTWEKMLAILLFWAGKGIDGFRCDMAEMVPVEFWAYAIPRVKEKHPGAVFIAEIYNPDQYRNYLHRGKFDYLYDKVGLYDTLRSIITGHQPAKAITACWQSVDDIQPQMLNFLENHDEQRIASAFFAGNPFKALPALVVSATLNTNPFMVYFGQERGEPGMDAEGFSGCDGRTSIFDYWSLPSFRDELSDAQRDLHRYYRKILQLCNQSKAIREGMFYDLMYVNPPSEKFNPDKQYAYLRCHEEELLLIVANFADKDADLNVFLPAHAFETFGIKEAPLKDSFFPLRIKAYDAAIISLCR